MALQLRSLWRIPTLQLQANTCSAGCAHGPGGPDTLHIITDQPEWQDAHAPREVTEDPQWIARRHPFSCVSVVDPLLTGAPRKVGRWYHGEISVNRRMLGPASCQAACANYTAVGGVRCASGSWIIVFLNLNSR